MKPRFYETPFEHVTYALVVNEKQLHKVSKDKSLDFLSLGKCAQTRFKERKGKTMAIVELRTADRPRHATYALLTHEAVHIWQAAKEAMGEDAPSCEFEAYSIQRIAQDLFYEYDRLIACG